MPRKRKPAPKRRPAARKPAPKKPQPQQKKPQKKYTPTKGVRSGALNVKHTNSPREQIEDLKRAMSQADIVSLSEVRRGSALIKWAKRKGYGVYVAKGRAADNAIIWNKREVKLVRNPRSMSLNSLEGARGGARERFAAYGLFEDRQSGNQFWQIAANTVNLHRGNPKLNDRIMEQQYDTLAKLAKQLSKSAPVLLAGDLNYKHPKIANLQSDRDGKGIMHVMAGEGFDIRKTKAIGGLNTDKKFIMSVLKFDKDGKPGKPGKPDVAQPPSIPEPEKPQGPVFGDLPTIQREFTGYWEGDMGGGPMQIAPGAPPKRNGDPLVAALTAAATGTNTNVPGARVGGMWTGPSLDSTYRYVDGGIESMSGQKYTWAQLDDFLEQAQMSAFGTTYYGGREDSRLPSGMPVRVAIAIGYGPFAGHNVSTIPYIRMGNDDARNTPGGGTDRDVNIGIDHHNSQWGQLFALASATQPNIDPATAAEMLSKVSTGFFVNNDW